MHRFTEAIRRVGFMVKLLASVWVAYLMCAELEKEPRVRSPYRHFRPGPANLNC